MAHGLPDWQSPINIEAQTLASLAVDIIAQTLAALKVDITAQTLTSLAVDIAAQTLAEMDVNITAQDLAELVIKINAQVVGIWLVRDWSAKEATDKFLTGEIADVVVGWNTILSYTPAAGKVLYLDDINYYAAQYATQIRVTVAGTMVWQEYTIAAQRTYVPFTIPRKATAGQQVLVQRNSAHNTSYQIWANVFAREYDV